MFWNLVKEKRKVKDNVALNCFKSSILASPNEGGTKHPCQALSCMLFEPIFGASHGSIFLCIVFLPLKLKLIS